MSVTRGILEMTRQIPTTTREWDTLLRQINDLIQVQGDQAYITAVISLADRAGIPVADVLALIGDDGRLTSQFALPTVNVSNVSSVQDSSPLSATSDAISAEISVSAHVLQTDFGPISYGPGSLAGLALNERYYVYADDPDYVGGSVTYLATTNKTTVTSITGRYLVGSIITPVSANSTSITAATSANPIVFTTGTHGWNSGDTVQFSGLPGDFGTNLNGQQKIITVLSPTMFSIPVDGLLYAAYTSGGNAARVVDSTEPDYGGGAGGALP
jgi:hypothetical protein